jgi:dTDP-4-dehydrorhamnose reductase
MTGARGLVGSVFIRDFAHQYDITNLDLSGTPSVDITNLEQLHAIFATSSAEWVIHCAAFTDVTAAWQQNGDQNGIAYQVNVVGTENIVQACAETGKKLIHISTAYVFDGTKPEPYLENNPRGAVEWYGKTKQVAEDVVMASTIQSVILRIDNPFRLDSFIKPDLVRRTIAKLHAGQLPPQFADATFGPTLIDDLVKVFDWVMRTNASGIYHATANESWTPYDFARAVARVIGIDDSLVLPGSLTEYLKTSQRPYPRNTALNSQKLRSQLDFQPLTVATALAKLSL